MSTHQICRLAALLLVLAGAVWPSLAGLITVEAAGLPPVPLEPRQYLPMIMGGLKDTPLGPHTVELPAAATWRLFSTGTSYDEARRGANLLVNGPDYPFAEVGQHHTHWDQYYIEKDFMVFNTAPLPASASVLSATLNLAGCTAIQANQPFGGEFYPASIGLTVTAADWNAYGGSLVASFPASACGTGPLALTLEPASVRLGATTPLALVTDRIRLGQEPLRDQGDTAQIATAHGAVSLNVTYREQ